MLYPLRFEPIFRRYIWGGRRLETVLRKQIGAGDDYAESWEVVDHGVDQSVVKFGDLSGTSLHELVMSHGEELFGQHYPQSQFPLLFKFLDAQRDLSVQVHPNDEQGAGLTPPDLGKTEAWVILDAEPGSKVYAGLAPGIGRDELVSAVEKGETAACLHQFEPRVGDCVFIPAGTVHALGAGLVVAEIQQASDTTFRLFDWNRKDAYGNSRQLHIDEAMQVIDFMRGPVYSQQPTDLEQTGRVRLVECDKFVLDRWCTRDPIRVSTDERCHMIAVLSGSVDVAGDPSGVPLVRGSTMLIPASHVSLDMTPSDDALILHMFLP